MPKTHRAQTIDLDSVTFERLRQHRERHSEDQHVPPMLCQCASPIEIRLNGDGPRLVDIPKALRRAARRGFFEKSQVHEVETIARESADPTEEKSSQGMFTDLTSINR